ncbi:hypothetical protein [Oceanispirochaeta sp.]|jgi:hypothetical protein|uniref:hypothetical protein n=1 Tax=Oceanispirochaeta sp. TaxID=2035350 RepID=UPI00261753F7|nr:hypothetical protein [Oceanispirochaeta sp.]MDA3955233.1 hypothetical protein [Oceanispirochaeta sp.]
MKKLIVFLLFLTLSIMALTAQSNTVMDEFLSREGADATTSLLLIAQATGQLPGDASPSDAIKWREEQSWGGKFANQDDQSITSGRFHLALFQSFSIKGGIMYSLFKSPRLAALEAGYQGFVTGTPYVNHRMTPEEVLSSLSMALEMQEAKQ